ncbi:MAG: glycosyltransferase [Candidatus Binataceae bacterium]
MSNFNAQLAPLSAHGKFFRRGTDKFFFKAMRLEPGPLDFNHKLALLNRFEKLKAGHTNGLILRADEAEPVLGLAAQAGLLALAEFTIGAAELTSRHTLDVMLDRLARVAGLMSGHRALAGFLIDCSIEADELRHYGLRRAKRRLAEVVRVIRRHNPDKLIAVNHRPSTCALALLEEDVLYATLPAIAPDELLDFMMRLHNLAEARPVIIEFGPGSPHQDELVACAFGLGAAGVVAPPIRTTPDGANLNIRMFRAGELLPFVALNGSCPPAAPQQPRVSVVVCAYNAERTMRPCLESLRKLDYPAHEVIIVDDGSRDRTAEITAEFPEFRLIRQPNRGLSEARNVGLHAAQGELVAYTDSDCVADPHWLTLMVRAITERGLDGCGGPNYAPHEEGWVEACVAAAPGAPCHVLMTDDRAEHLAGCNMVFSIKALIAIGGFDPQFTSAGDDVDVCWRLLAAGYHLGFCPAAFVWHFRRNSVRAYYGQQRGYGRAEAMLYLKYPERFNALGQIKWRGNIPGLARTVPGGLRIRASWTRARGGLQTVSERPVSILKFLPLTLEWNLAATLVLAVSLLDGVSMPALLALGALSLGPLWALYYAGHAPIEKPHRGFFARLFVAALAYTGPMMRALARHRYGAAVTEKAGSDFQPAQRPKINWRKRMIQLAYWNERHITRDMLLERLSIAFAKSGRPVLPDHGWNDFDFTVRSGSFAQIELKTADEEHEGMRLKNHVAARIRLSKLGRHTLLMMPLLSLGAALAGLAAAATASAIAMLICAVLAISEALEAGRLAYLMIERCALELALIPLGRPTAAARRAARSMPGIITPAAPPGESPRIAFRMTPGDGKASAEIAQPAGR